MQDPFAQYVAKEQPDPFAAYAAPAPPATSSRREAAQAILKQTDADEAARTQQGREFLTGVGKSVFGTIEGGGKLIRAVPGIGPALSRGPSLPMPNTTPTTPAEQWGKTAGNVAQFFVPGAALAKVKTALTSGVGILDMLVSAGLEGASATTVDAAQRGTTDNAGKMFGLTAGFNVGTSAGLKALGWLGQRVENALIKGSAADFKHGYNPINIFKYKLGGSLSQTYDKADQKIGELGRELRAALKATPASGPVPEVDVLGALAETAQDLMKQPAKTFGANANIERAVNQLLEDPLFQTVAKTGKVDPATANEIKQAVGDLGAWLHDPSGRVYRDPESKGMEIVANALYTKLRTAIEAKAVGPVAAINKQLSDILPIRQAIIRRMPVEQRANVLNLGDLIGLSTGTWGIALANRVLRSGQAAQAMVNTAERAGPIAAGTTRTAAGLGSQIGEQ